jgi:hypothetical protein
MNMVSQQKYSDFKLSPCSECWIQKYSDFHRPESKLVSAECDTVLTDTFLLTYHFFKKTRICLYENLGIM